MEFKEFIKNLHELYEENYLKKIFEKLKEELDDESEQLPLFRNLSRRYNDYNDDKMANVLDPKEASVIISKIGKSLQDFIGKLKEEDLGKVLVYTHREIANEILIFTRTEKTKTIKEFFLQLNFINVKVLSHGAEKYVPDDFDLIIFDNQDLPVCRSKKHLDELEENMRLIINNRIEKMDAIINGSSKFLIHFGDFLFWINSNRDRVQAANSRFSLHARTREVIDFINTYRV